LKNSPTLHFNVTVSSLVKATARLPSFLDEELAGKPAEVHTQCTFSCGQLRAHVDVSMCVRVSVLWRGWVRGCTRAPPVFAAGQVFDLKSMVSLSPSPAA
jgi:hypothetical protein